MRTTLTIQDALLRKAKQASLERNLSVGEVVEEALRLTLGAQAKGRPAQRRKLKTFRGDGLQPGVDLTSSAALLEFMGGR
jgi:hypothetical protein